jgi:hypothetical protein
MSEQFATVATFFRKQANPETFCLFVNPHSGGDWLT